MLTDLYVAGESPLHHARPALKLAALAGFCTGLFLVDLWPVLILGLLGTAIGYWLAGLELRHAWLALRPVLWLLVLIFLAQLYFAGPSLAAFVVLRFAILILAATLVTLTTRASEFVDGIEAALARAPACVPAKRIALAIALSLRFIPMTRRVLAEVREARIARGQERDIVALIVPVIIRTLKNADEVSEAIHARSFDG